MRTHLRSRHEIAAGSPLLDGDRVSHHENVAQIAVAKSE